MPRGKWPGISARYVNNPPRGEGSQDRPPTPGLALDSGNPKRLGGSGDSFPAPGLAFCLGALAAAECDLRATYKWELFVLINKLDLFCLLMAKV